MKLVITTILLCFLSRSYAQDISNNIEMRDEETGIRQYEYDIKEDSYLVEASYATDFFKITNIQAFRGQITWFQNPYSWVAYAAKSSAIISKVSKLTGSFDRGNEYIDVIELGPGISRRSKLINEFVNNPNIYDETMFALTYAQASSSVFEESYAGFGMLASYGLFYRTSKSFHWSLKLDYHLNSLDGTDSLDNKIHTTLSWISSAVGLGFYF